jgi:UPF0755 protein
LRVLVVGLLVLGAGGALVAGVAAYVWRELHTPLAPPPAGAVVSVPAGASFRAVAGQLQRAGMLRHPELLSAWARWYGLDRRVHSGEYRIDRPLSPLQILDLLQTPSRALHRVTIPEGYTARQIAAVLEREGFGGRDLFRCVMRDPLLLAQLDLPATGVEGFMFPDTYAFSWSTEPHEIIRTMVTRFREQVEPLTARRIAAGMTEVEMVTLASVIEKETGRGDERPLISGVFHNRLRLSMPLQSDPTVFYGLNRLSGRLTRADLQSSSRYNTYAHVGLPPGPIANPGRAALEAAIVPVQTEALYFVSRNDGSHEFSETLPEHNRAVQRYQRAAPRRHGGTETD